MTWTFFGSILNAFPGGGCGRFLVYPAATNSFRETGTRRCSALNLRSACVKSAKTLASPASDATVEVSAFVSAEAVAGSSEELLPHPMHSNETAQIKNRRNGMAVV